jgi:hypothetical protein
MSHLHNIIVLRADMFTKFQLLGTKTSDVLIINVYKISMLTVKPGGTTFVDVTRVYR